MSRIRVRATLTAAGAALLGPAAAVMYASGSSWIPASIVGVALVAGAGAVGAAVGAWAVLRGAKVTGLVCFFVSSVVLALYGFLALFFGLGGSR